MALAERLKQANAVYHNTFICKLMQVTTSPKLSEDDINALIRIINSNPGDEDHVPNNRLSQALREEGFDVSASAVDRHRRRSCSCTRLK